MFSTTHKDNGCCSKDECSEFAHEAGHKLREAIDKASSEVRDATDATMEQVRSKPVQSSLIALGIGFLSGLLLRRR